MASLRRPMGKMMVAPMVSGEAKTARFGALIDLK